jgi:hypothetical protein
LTFRQDEAVSLTVHSLGPQSSGDQENLLIFPFSKLLRDINESNLNASVFLGGNTFTLGTIVICTGLPIKSGEDSEAFAVGNFVVGLQVSELPADERVIVGVLLRGEEGASPVSVDTELLHILAALIGEDFEPVPRVLELRNINFREVKLLQDFILSENAS